MLFALITPPFQSPDESQHYLKAVALAEGKILAERRGDEVGATVPDEVLQLRESDFPAETPGVPVRFTAGQLAKAWSADADRPGEGFGFYPNIANYSPTLYAPQALGIWLGEAVGLPRLGGFYLARLINSGAALLLLVLALRLMPFGQTALLAVAALPTTCYQAGSASPDAMINAMAFTGLALALRFGLSGSHRQGPAAVYVMAPLLALAKGVYLPLMAAGLQPRANRADRRPLHLIGAMAIAALIFVFWMKANGGSQVLYTIVSRKTGETTTTAPMAEQLAVILHDPAGYLKVLASSMRERAPVYALQIVGRFGWNTILMPLAAYPLALLMLGSGVLSGSGTRFGVIQRLWWLLIALGCVLLVETALYLTGTPLGADFVQGVQGRYFLPVLPLALLALMPRNSVWRMERVFELSAMLLLAIGLLTAIDAFWIHGFTSVDGLPPHHSIAGMIALPSPRW